jgi:hypothetical protein
MEAFSLVRDVTQNQIRNKIGFHIRDQAWYQVWNRAGYQGYGIRSAVISEKIRNEIWSQSIYQISIDSQIQNQINKQTRFRDAGLNE